MTETRSRNISKRLSKGIEYLMKKNNIDHINCTAKLIDKNSIYIADLVSPDST